ncbi:MAG: hypothetical protein Q9204_006784, partial [Flavoplaca sp. TL-2023a]
VDAGGKSEITVTEDERARAYNLLWPPDRQPETTHQLLDKIQNLAEKPSYSFSQRQLPEELNTFKLSQWRQIIMRSCHSTVDEEYLAELNEQLQKAGISTLSNAPSHRQSFKLYIPKEFYDGSKQFEAYFTTAKTHVRAIGDEETALEIESFDRDVPRALYKTYDNK